MTENKIYEILKDKFFNGYQNHRDFEVLIKQGFCLGAKW